MGPVMRRTFALATVGLTLFAGASVIAFKKSIDAASNLTEQINKASVVFRGSEKIVIAWSETTSRSIGISQRAALEFAGVFGNMLVPMGFAREEAARMSTQLVELAADMASFNNASPEEVLEAIRAGLAGETEPLRRFGIFLSEARIQQIALNEGLVQGKEKLTSAGKAAAIYRIILKDTADAQGDFARTSDSFANSQRTTRAALEDVAARIGAVFLPAVTNASNALNDWLQDEDNIRMLERWAEALEEGVATALRGIASWIRTNRADIVSFFRETADTIGDVASAADDVAKKVGGWDELFKFAVLITSLKKLQGVAAAAGAGSGLLGAAGAAGLLRTRLLLLSRLGVIAIPIALYIYKDDLDRLNDWVRKHTGAPLWGGIEGPDPASGGKPAATTARGMVVDPRGGGVTTWKTAGLSAKYGGLQPGTSSLAGFVEASGGTITAGREAGHSPTGGHGVGQSLDISWANNGPRIWAALFPHRAKFRLLLGPPGLYMWGQRYYNERDAKNHQDHIHVQYQGSSAELRKMLGDKAPEITGATGIETGTDAIETSADTSTAAGGAGAKKATIDPGELSRAQSKAGWIEGHADVITSPAVRARLRQRAANIAKILGDVTDPKVFATATRNLNALDRDWQKAVELTAATKQARATAASISSALGNMPEALQRELAPKVAKLNRELGNVTSKRQLDRIRKDLEAIQETIKAAVERMVETVERRRDAFGAAFGKVADKALQIFDAKTEDLIRRAAAQVDDLDARLRGKTPAEIELERFRAEREAASRASSRATSLAGAETPEERAVLEAQFALEDRERQLEELAAVERAALEKEVDEQRRAREAAAAVEQDRIRDERAILKERFQGRYDEIVRSFQNEEITAEEARNRMLALLADPEYAADFAEAGKLIGDAFALSFSQALESVAAAVRALRAAIQGVADATGQPMPGETSAERALRLRSEALNKKYGLGFATGGRVPGRYVGRDDTVMGRLSPGEYVLDRNLTAKLEQLLANGGAGGPVVAEFYLDGQRFARAIAQPVTDEQSRIISYRSTRS
jgi:hypothetical protein